LHADSLYAAGARPSSVQQNVPAWLLFAMFFIAIPLSTTWVQERQQGTYARLRSMGMSPVRLLLGKLVPYLGITLLQAVLMLAVGVWLVPLLGGGRLELGHAPAALCMMALAASFAAVSYALLVANLVSTAEQATIFTGVANLLMAAVGGIMVPRFVMPVAMQAVSLYSPMSWGLEGFLDVFLRQGDLRMAAPWALRLLVFGLVCLGLAAARLNLRRRS
jgi:ABC-2 type transport system permease protein